MWVTGSLLHTLIQESMGEKPLGRERSGRSSLLKIMEEMEGEGGERSCEFEQESQGSETQGERHANLWESYLEKELDSKQMLRSA